MPAPCPIEIVDQRIPTAETALAFRTSTAELLASAGPALDGVACLLANDPALTVQVEVHSDARGAEDWNFRLTQERADAVRAALVARGADASRVTAVGYGERFPADAHSPTSAANRRIELHTAPPSSRPPRPAPAGPAPVPPPDPCAGWRDLGPEPPAWAPCTTEGTGWRCTLPVPYDAAVERVDTCFGGAVSRDGTLLVLKVGDALLQLDRDAEGRAILRR